MIDCQLKIHSWPFRKDAAFCLNFDDFSPFYWGPFDFGGNLKGRLIKQQELLLAKYDLKITHFVVPRSNFFLPLTSKVHKIINYKTNKYSLSNIRNSDWIKYVNELLLSNKIEIGMHGYRHFNNQIKKKHQEFYYDNYHSIKEKIIKSKQVFEKAQIPIYGFRPPGWGIDKDENLIRVIYEMGYFDYIAASSINAGLNKDKQRVDNFMPSWYCNLLNIPQNVELDSNIDKLINEIDSIIKQGKLISLKGHFTNVRWISNNFNKNNFEKLIIVLDYLKRHNVWYATFNEVANYFKAITSSVIEEKTNSSGSKLYNIKLSKNINGLTLSLRNNYLNNNFKEIISDSRKITLNKDKNYKVIFNLYSDKYTLEII